MPQHDPPDDWHARPAADCYDALDSGPDGLDGATAAERLERVGPNEIESGHTRGPVRVLLAQFASALIWVLLAAAAISLVIGHTVDAVLIGIILLANGIFGFVQEYRAERSLDALREMAAPEVRVRRDGSEATVHATELVPGDVLVLSGGDVVPADCRLLAERSLEVDEAPLTGESVPVEKDTGTVPADTPLAERTNAVFKGTHVTRGSATALVVATGMGTEMGAIATALLSAGDARTPLQRDLDSLGRKLGVGVLALSVVLIPLLVVGGTALIDAALTAISLSVAAIPEGLPAVVTLTLALGVRRMADENALVRTLPAVEGLGSVDVVCTDKTGTLTEGEMRVRAAWVDDETVPVGGDDDARANGGTRQGDDAAGTDGGVALADERATDERFERLLTIGAVCNDATVADGDPTERALVRAARDAGLDVARLREHHPRVDEQPFSSERKRMATVHEDVAYVKGAPQVVLDRSTRVLGAEGPTPMDEATRERIQQRIETFADDALRVLAFAYTEDTDDPESDLIFVGLQGLLDPPRPEVADAIADTHRAGIDVKMITGDNARTARAIAARIGLGDGVMTGQEIEGLSDDELQDRVEEATVFARAEPTHKVRVLQALQARDHTVAMTGDGVNDAPALKNADIGIAMGVRGTDVAKQASDVVLLDDNYATIRTAIRRGRTIFDNVWKFVAYLLSANAAEVALVFIASLGGYLVLPAVQLLWINLLTDGLPALALGTDPAGDVMDREPRDRSDRILDREMLGLIGGFGTVATAVMLALMFYTLDGAAQVTPYAMTMVFTGFVIFEFAKLYVVRWARDTPLVSNPWLALSVVASFGLHLTIIYTPLRASFGTVALSPADWGLLGVVLAVGTPLLALVALLIQRVVDR